MGFLSKAFKGLVGGVTGFFAGGPVGALIGGAAGFASGYAQDRAAKQQEAMMNAQLASAQKIADAQNPANVVSATATTSQKENAETSETNEASEASRRYSFSKTIYKRRSGKLGSSSGSSGVKKDTLG